MTPSLVLRDRPYGGTMRTPRKPLLTEVNPVISVTVTFTPPDLSESILTVGQVAAAISAQGHTVSSYTITRLDAYAETDPSGGTHVVGALRYVPTNRAWLIDGTDYVTAGTLTYVPPVVSSGPFSSSQAASQLLVIKAIQAVIIRMSVVTVKPAFSQVFTFNQSTFGESSFTPFEHLSVE
jgi:hypothetical protein